MIWTISCQNLRMKLGLSQQNQGVRSLLKHFFFLLKHFESKTHQKCEQKWKNVNNAKSYKTNKPLQNNGLKVIEVKWKPFWRWGGDSNPRNSFPFVSLANWWFKPLTHLTNGAANIVLSKFLYKRLPQSFLWNSQIFLRSNPKSFQYFCSPYRIIETYANQHHLPRRRR